MKTATKLFTKAIILEFIFTLIVVTTLITSFDYYFSLKTINIFVGLLIGLLPLIPLTYRLGEKKNYTKKSVSERFFLGILLQFLFLTILFSFPTLLMCVFWGRITFFFKLCFLTADFYLFSCFHTIIIGIWLGYKLSEINDN